jgi:hypothetical protein
MAYPKSYLAGFISASIAALFTNPASQRTRVVEIELHNVGVETEVTIFLAPNNAGSVRTVIADDMYQRETIVLTSGETSHLSLGYTLDAENDSIQMVATNADTVSVAIHTVEEVI